MNLIVGQLKLLAFGLFLSGTELANQSLGTSFKQRVPGDKKKHHGEGIQPSFRYHT